MMRKQGIATVLGLALVAMTSTDGGAAERPGQAMADVGTRLGMASTHAATLEAALDRMTPSSAPVAPGMDKAAPGEHDIGAGSEGGGFPAKGAGAMPARPGRKVTGEIKAALDGLETAVREAKTIAGPQEYLDPGFEHVLANAGRIRANGELSADALTLSQEIDIELVALANNASVLEAEAELRAAKSALGTGRAAAMPTHIAAAVGALTEAQNKGAYHLEDDIAALNVVAARLRKGMPTGEAVTGGDMDELIADVHEHLADLGGD